MARFRFTYAAILRYRELRERQAELRQWQAHHEWQACRAAEEALLGRIRETAAGLQPRLGQGQSVETWLALYRQVARLEQDLKAARQRTEEAAHAWQEASAGRAQAARDAEVLRQLQDRQG